MTEKRILQERIKVYKGFAIEVCLFFLFLSLIVSFKVDKIFYGLYIGLFLGNLSFQLLVKVFDVPKSKGYIHPAFMIMFILKFAAITLISYLLFRNGVSIYQFAVGLVLSQLAVMISFIYNISLKK